MNKRGLSGIVTTVLIILIAIAGIVLIWNFVLPLVSQDISTDELTTRLTIPSKNVLVNNSGLEKNVTFILERKSGQGAVSGLTIVLSDINGKTKSFDDYSNTEIKEISSIKLSLKTSELGNISKIEVYPIFVDSDGKKTTGSSGTEYVFSGKEKTVGTGGTEEPVGCIDECSSGDTRCSGSGVDSGFQTCEDYDSDSCFEWSSVVVYCAPEDCRDGECVNSQTQLGNLPTEFDLTGIVGYWRFNETGTTTIAKDISGNGNHLTLYNFGFLPTSSGWVASSNSKFGNVLKFDGANDFVQGTVGGIPLGNSPRTVTMWVNTTTCTHPFSYGSGSSSRGFFGIYDCDLKFLWNPASSFNPPNLNYVASGNWVFIALTWSGSDMITWVDDSSDTWTLDDMGAPLDTQESDLFVSLKNSDSNSVSYFYKGSIAELTVWNRTLYPYEIQEIYDSTK